MKLKLYEIQQEYISLAEQLIDNGGELTPELENSLQINREQLESKGQCYGFIVKDLESDIDKIDGELKRLTALKSSRNKTIDKLKETISKAMELHEIEKLETPTLKISFRKSESVEVPDPNLLDKNYMVSKTTEQPDKEKIKYYLKQGVSIQGAILKQNKNLQIK